MLPQKRDPFRPPVHEERSLELATPPPATPVVQAPLIEPPTVRKPVRYRRPRVSWLTMVVLGFAAVGAVAVSGVVMRRVSGLGRAPRPQAAAVGPVVYRPLADDNAVLVELRVTPREARVMLDGEPVTSNPLRVPRGSAMHKLAVTAEGFTPTVEEFTADGPKTIRLRLTRAR